ncbi:MAG: hypothetical protein OHK0012_13580 [Synechococcales cyanobacterium]
MTMVALNLLQPVQQAMGLINWENRSAPAPSLIGIPATILMRDWSVEQFFSAIPWQPVRDPQPEAVPVYEEDPMFTLSDFAGLF